MSNIFVFAFLKEFALACFWSTWLATMLKEGSTLTNGCIYLGLFFLSVAAFEIPTGILADKYGRKKGTLIGIGFLGFGFFLNSLGNHPMIQYSSFMIAGTGTTLLSGACSAWLLATARNMKKEMDTEKFFLELDLIGRIATITGAFLGPYLLIKSPILFWRVIAIICYASVAIGFTIPALPLNRGKVSLRQFDLRQIALETIKKPILVLIFMATLFFGFENGIRNIIYQPFIVDLNHGYLYSLTYFQITLAIARIAGILTYRFLLKPLNWGPELSASALGVFGITELLCRSTNTYAEFTSIYCVGIFCIGCYFPVKEAFLNNSIHESSRATLLSFDSMFNNLAAGLSCILLGFTIDRNTLQGLWGYCGLFLLLSSCFLFVAARTARLQKGVQQSENAVGILGG